MTTTTKTRDGVQALRLLAGFGAMALIVGVTFYAALFLIVGNAVLLLGSVALRVAIWHGRTPIVVVGGLSNGLQFSAKALASVWKWTLAS